MLAHAQGTPLNPARLASSIGVTSPSVGRYIDLLVDLRRVCRLRPWAGNVGKRRVRTPKVYLRDSGLTHALLEIETWEDLLGHPVAGASWEGFVIEHLIAAAGDRRTPYFYGMEDGAEIERLFERRGKPERAIEIKRSSAPTPSHGFQSARQALNVKECYLVHGGTDTWPESDGVTAMGRVELMRKLARQEFLSTLIVALSLQPRWIRRNCRPPPRQIVDICCMLAHHVTAATIRGS